MVPAMRAGGGRRWAPRAPQAAPRVVRCEGCRRPIAGYPGALCGACVLLGAGGRQDVTAGEVWPDADRREAALERLEEDLAGL